MQHWTLLEIFADLHAQEMRRQALKPERRAPAGGLRRALAQGLVGLGRRLDADAGRDAAGSGEGSPRSSSSDA